MVTRKFHTRKGLRSLNIWKPVQGDTVALPVPAASTDSENLRLQLITLRLLQVKEGFQYQPASFDGNFLPVVNITRKPDGADQFDQ